MFDDKMVTFFVHIPVIVLLLFCILIRAETNTTAEPTPVSDESVIRSAVLGQSFVLNCTSTSETFTYIEWRIPVNASSAKVNQCSIYIPSVSTGGEKDGETPQCALPGFEIMGINFMIKKVGYQHEGIYTCRAFNASNLYRMQIKLLVQSISSPPLYLNTTLITQDSVTVEWGPPNNLHNLPVMDYLISHKLSTSTQDFTEWKDVSGKSTILRYSFVNLKSYTRYSFAVKTLNKLGESNRTLLNDVVTLEGSPTSSAVNVRVRTAGSTNASIILVLSTEQINGVLKHVALNLQQVRKLDSQGLQKKSVLNIIVPKSEFGDSASYIKEIKGLDPFCRYNLSYHVQNNRFAGPVSYLSFDTAEGVSEAPTLFPKHDGIYDKNFSVQWFNPQNINGIPLHYKLKIVNVRLNTTVSIDIDKDVKEYLYTDAEPYSKYDINVGIQNKHGLGSYSNTLQIQTDPTGPPKPLDVKADLEFEDSIRISWKLDSFPSFPDNLLFFRIHWRAEDLVEYFVDTQIVKVHGVCLCNTNFKMRFKEKNVCVSYPDRYCFFINWQDLTSKSHQILDKSHRSFEFKVQSMSVSMYDNNRHYFGGVSEPHMERIPTKLLSQSSNSRSSLDQTIIAGVVIGSVVVLLAFCIILFLSWKWVCSHRGYQGPVGHHETLDFLEHEYTAGATRPEFQLYAATPHSAFPVGKFRDHMILSHANDNSAFQLEFEEIQRVTQKDWPSGHWKMLENQTKNRYTDIYPYDHSRVVLFANTSKKCGDYINANYIDGYHRRNAYIAAQGPLPSTFDDFWLMIWENKCNIVVMISNFVERGRRKCDQYWPTEGTQTYGFIQVKLMRTMLKAYYGLRVFGIRNLRSKKTAKDRIIYHYHYTDWPDFGTPLYTLPVLNFVQRSVQHWREENGPIVVHCSAGVGRTGTYICIESQIRQILAEKSVNVRGFLEHIRQQRMRLCQTEDQYVFIHDVLLEFLLCPEREVSRERLSHYVHALTHYTEPCGCSRMETQYQLCVSYQPAYYDMVSATKVCNQSKNRADIFPVELRRIKLTSEPGVEGSDYINASYLHGFFFINEFIITQHPLDDTVNDFYKMLWDQNATTVVCLSQDTDLPVFWPSDPETIKELGYLQVQFRSKEEHSFATRIEFLLASSRDDYSLVTSLWILKRWPKTLGESVDLIKLIKSVIERRKQSSAPTVVFDTYGGSFAGIFCILHFLYNQLLVDNSVDVYSAFKMYHLQRPGVFNSQADLEFIYEVIDHHAKLMSPSNSLSHREVPPTPSSPLGGSSACGTLDSNHQLVFSNGSVTQDSLPSPPV